MTTLRPEEKSKAILLTAAATLVFGLGAALAGFALAFLFLLLMEEKPLRASAARAADAAAAD